MLKKTSKTKHVVFVVYPDIVILDLVGPLQVFTSANFYINSSNPAYETTIVSRDGGKIKTNTLISIETNPLAFWKRRSIDTLVVVGGMGAYTAAQDLPFVKMLTGLIKRSKRVCSVCSGAIVLAATGALNDRRAVTHWQDCNQLAQMFPQVKVETDPIFIKDGNVWTSAGITAGIDLSLAMVTEDYGQSTALEIARSLVTYMVRSGGQSQFSPVLNRQAMDKSCRFSNLHDWIVDNLNQDLNVEQLAIRSNMSARNFSRVYTSQMGITPAKSVEAFRIEAARQLLETTPKKIKTIAIQCGFVNEERMRRAFSRILGVSPNYYRQRFQND